MLKNLPDYFIEQSEEEGLDCTRMYIEQEEVEPSECRDTEEDAADSKYTGINGYVTKDRQK